MHSPALVGAERWRGLVARSDVCVQVEADLEFYSPGRGSDSKVCTSGQITFVSVCAVTLLLSLQQVCVHGRAEPRWKALTPGGGGRTQQAGLPQRAVWLGIQCGPAYATDE